MSKLWPQQSPQEVREHNILVHHQVCHHLTQPPREMHPHLQDRMPVFQICTWQQHIFKAFLAQSSLGERRGTRLNVSTACSAGNNIVRNQYVYRPAFLQLPGNPKH